MATSENLTDRLMKAAERAIRAEAGSLAFDQHRIRGLTIDFSVSAKGTVEPARVYVERQHIRPDTVG